MPEFVLNIFPRMPYSCPVISTFLHAFPTSKPVNSTSSILGENMQNICNIGEPSLITIVLVLNVCWMPYKQM